MKKLTIASIIAAALLTGAIYTLYPDPVAPDVYAPTSGISYEYSKQLRSLATPRFPAGVAFTVGKFTKMDNLVIYGAVFDRETPEEVFPKDMKGTIFLCTHLDNVLIPKGTDAEPNYVFNEWTDKAVALISTTKPKLTKRTGKLTLRQDSRLNL